MLFVQGVVSKPQQGWRRGCERKSGKVVGVGGVFCRDW
jgi:hypothetical protein